MANAPGPLKAYSKVVVGLVLGIYGTWSIIASADFITCRVISNWTKDCNTEMTELKSVFTTVTVGLIGWLSDPPTSR